MFSEEDTRILKKVKAKCVEHFGYWMTAYFDPLPTRWMITGPILEKAIRIHVNTNVPLDINPMTYILIDSDSGEVVHVREHLDYQFEPGVPFSWIYHATGAVISHDVTGARIRNKATKEKTKWIFNYADFTKGRPNEVYFCWDGFLYISPEQLDRILGRE